jgi:hypothetical protein
LFPPLQSSFFLLPFLFSPSVPSLRSSTFVLDARCSLRSCRRVGSSNFPTFPFHPSLSLSSSLTPFPRSLSASKSLLQRFWERQRERVIQREGLGSRKREDRTKSLQPGFQVGRQSASQIVAARI